MISYAWSLTVPKEHVLEVWSPVFHTIGWAFRKWGLEEGRWPTWGVNLERHVWTLTPSPLPLVPVNHVMNGLRLTCFHDVPTPHYRPSTWHVTHNPWSHQAKWTILPVNLFYASYHRNGEPVHTEMVRIYNLIVKSRNIGLEGEGRQCLCWALQYPGYIWCLFLLRWSHLVTCC